MDAAIDIGTNTIRLVFGEVVDGRVVPDRYERSIARLGGNRTPDKGLAPDAIERALIVLDKFSGLIASSRSRSVQAVATAAVRDAVNGNEFVSTVQQRCGLKVEIVSGDEEARLSAGGALSVVQPVPKYSLIVDIGGGSTELVYCDGTEVVVSQSYPIGAVRLHEVDSSTESQRLLDEFSAEIRSKFGTLNGISQTTLVGTAGTITTVAATLLKMTEYDWRRVNNYRFELAKLNKLYDQLLPLSVAEREQLPGIEQGRGDILPAGIEILQTIFSAFNKEAMTVTDFGLLEGLLLSLDRSPQAHPWLIHNTSKSP